MKIGSVNSGINPTVGYGTEAQSRPTEAKAQPVTPQPVTPVKQVSQEKSEVKTKSQAESLQEQEVLNEEMLSKAIAQANKSLEHSNRSIERSIHDVTHTVMYVVKDTSTNEVIAEFPPKKIQDMIAKMWELAGLFVDEKA